MRLSFYLVSIVLFGLIIFGSSSCKKDFGLSTGNLNFSADTIVFDTVFTTIGSTTKRLKIYNNDSKTLEIQLIELMGGSTSPYRINVDGVPGTIFSEIEIEGKDSLFIFIEVTLDPNNVTNPMIVEDRIHFVTNGQDQYVQLAAWGQDAYFHYSTNSSLDLNDDTDPWLNDKPHVIYGGAYIDSAKTLTIQPGTDIYLHKNAWLFVYKGTLNIQGTLTDPVTFQGDRLESYYDDVAGQYYGIYFYQARPSTIDYAIIKNGITGIHIDSKNQEVSGTTLTISNTIVQNNASYGMLLFQGASVKAENCILSNNGIHSFVTIGGGDFNFNHCHLLGYGGGNNQGSAIGISNYYNNPNAGATEVSDLNGVITNSVIYGTKEFELAIDTISFGGVTIQLDIQRNLIKSETILTDPNIFTNGNIWNVDPLFVDIEEKDYTFYSTSPLNNSGDSNFTVTTTSTFNADINNVTRTGPDIGAYEKP